MRDIDDKIIYALNTSLPTESFKGQVDSERTCRDLYGRLNTGHKEREEAIRNCIMVSAEALKHLREQRESTPDDVEIDKKFKSEQRKVRNIFAFKTNIPIYIHMYIFLVACFAIGIKRRRHC